MIFSKLPWPPDFSDMNQLQQADVKADEAKVIELVFRLHFAMHLGLVAIAQKPLAQANSLLLLDIRVRI